MVNVWMKPSSSGPVYASAYISEYTLTRELYVASEVLCSEDVTSVIVVPSADMVNVLMKPSPSVPVYASA